MFGTMATSNMSAGKKVLGFAAALALATQANAHLFLQYPKPIPQSAPKDPLDPSGSNFPCHGVDLSSVQGGGEDFAAGSSHLLQFDAGGGANTAVHGGGSCQVSVTYETDAEKVKDPKNWFVIHSMEGGCPTNSEGNLDGQYTGPQGPYSGAIQCSDPRANGVDCLNSYNFTIPDTLKDGKVTLAWTWFNTIGNREMYMNCVSGHVSGGSGSGMGELPTMFVANLAGAGLPQCSTKEGQFYKFPYAGNDVTSDTKGSQYKVAPVSGGSCAEDGAPAGGAAAGGSSTGGAAPGGGAAPSYGGGAPSGKPAGQGNDESGGQVTVTTMETKTSGNSAPTSAPAPAVSSAAPSAAAPAPSSAAPAAPAPYQSGSGSTSSGSGSCANGAVPCSNDGEVVCIGTQWGLCNAGCAVPQSLASGTHCVNGKIAKRDHVRRHIGRTHGRQFA